MTMPKENLFRSAPAFELRAAGDAETDAMPTMVVNFARFNEWTEIRSFFEGNFLERFAPGAFKKTFAERGDQIRALFQHGQDPVAGSKPLGPIQALREESDGAWGEVQLLDADYVRQIVPGLEAGLYGASFAFQVVREESVDAPKPSEGNPRGIREVTIKEARLREFGPVTFGQYENATAGVRSLTDDFLLERLAKDHPEGLRSLLQHPAIRELNIEMSGDVADLARALSETSSDEDEAPPTGTPASTLRLIGEAREREAKFAALRVAQFRA